MPVDVHVTEVVSAPDDERLYRTPTSYLDALLPVIDGPVLRYGWIWEPCAGDGMLVRWLAERVNNPRQIIASEIVPGRLPDLEEIRIGACLTEDFRQHSLCSGYDLVVTNPPFNLAIDVAAEGIRRVIPGGMVVLLNRLQWLASTRLATFFAKHPPSVYVLPWRESFVPSGATDQWDYAWYVWEPGRRKLPRVGWLTRPGAEACRHGKRRV